MKEEEEENNNDRMLFNCVHLINSQCYQWIIKMSQPYINFYVIHISGKTHFGTETLCIFVHIYSLFVYRL